MTTPVQSAAIPFPGAPNPDAAAAKNERLRDAVFKEMEAAGISPDEIMVPVRLPAGGQYLDPTTGTIGTVASERQYRALEKQNAERLRDDLRNEAANAASSAERYKAEAAEFRPQIAAWESELDQLTEGDVRRVMLDRQIWLLRGSLVATAAAETANRQTAQEATAAAKTVKETPIPRPVRWLAQSELGRAQERARRKRENGGVQPMPFLPGGPRPGSDEFFGIKK